MKRQRLGLIVNPIAGIGGRVGLKGSDGPEIQRRALALGAEPRAGERAAAALEPLRPLAADHRPARRRRRAWARPSPGAPASTPRVVPVARPRRRSHDPPTSEDTRRAARAMQEAGADLILFAGGDGTARDMFEAVGGGVPVLGIPAGVKMHSAVYAVDPRSAGDLAADYLRRPAPACARPRSSTSTRTATAGARSSPCCTAT